MLNPTGHIFIQSNFKITANHQNYFDFENTDEFMIFEL